MPPKKRRAKPQKKKKHVILILLLIAVGVFFLYEEFGKEELHRSFYKIFGHEEKKDVIRRRPPADSTPPEALPKVAIVIDDLGPNKKMAMGILVINAPLTLSILPQEVYSSWIAEEGFNLGRDIIVHVPMEATRPLKLGKGGLYTWMTDEEIAKILNKDILSVPHATGISSHMGSAFTSDKRVMSVVIEELKKQGVFFLDSVTSPKTIGYTTAVAKGLTAYRRDVFLDDSNDPRDIAHQWERLVETARRNGYALAQGHARKNTIEFLEDILKNNKTVRVVPLTELID
jgi:polysaccharide deacetylase 2 family uncharacterized protein YibQ